MINPIEQCQWIPALTPAEGPSTPAEKTVVLHVACQFDDQKQVAVNERSCYIAARKSSQSQDWTD